MPCGATPARIHGPAPTSSPTVSPTMPPSTPASPRQTRQSLPARRHRLPATTARFPQRHHTLPSPPAYPPIPTTHQFSLLLSFLAGPAAASRPTLTRTTTAATR